MEDLLLILGQTVVIVGSLGWLNIYVYRNTGKRICDKIDSLTQQISEANERARFASMEREIAGLRADVSGLKTKFSSLEERFSGLEKKFSGMEGKVDSLHFIIAPKLELKEA